MVNQERRCREEIIMLIQISIIISRKHRITTTIQKTQCILIPMEDTRVIQNLNFHPVILADSTQNHPITINIMVLHHSPIIIIIIIIIRIHLQIILTTTCITVILLTQPPITRRPKYCWLVYSTKRESLSLMIYYIDYFLNMELCKKFLFSRKPSSGKLLLN